jgi:5-methylcytosine-specific restriction protein A
VDSGRCDKHQHDRSRGSANDRGYNYRWQKESKVFLAQHPLCMCELCQEGKLRLRAATVVDHKRAHRGDAGLMWDRNNWQSMAKECHDRKTAREDGGFGRAAGGG